MNPERLPWIFGPLGLVLGVTIGLYLAWGVFEGTSVGGSIARLHPTYKEQYIRMAASAYVEERDLRQARQRLDELGGGVPEQWVAELAREDARAGDHDSASRLARLALALAVTDPQIVALAVTPTPTSPATLTWVWEVIERATFSCAELNEGDRPMILARTVDDQGRPLGGISLSALSVGGERVSLQSDSQGEARLPFRGSWTLTLAEGVSVSVNDEILVGNCAQTEQGALHGYRITFQRRQALE